MHRDQTITTLVETDGSADHLFERIPGLRERIAAAKAVREKLRKALHAGWDPAELSEQYNAAAAEKRAAEAAMAATPDRAGPSRDELETYVDQLGDIGEFLNRASAEELGELYVSLRLSLTYHHTERTVDVEVDPLADRVDKLVSEGGLEPPRPAKGTSTSS